MSKYRAVRTGKYASKREANRAYELGLLLEAGWISDLREQVSFDLLSARPDLGYSRPLRYVADFVYCDKADNQTIVEDVKGMETPVYRIKKRMMLQLLGIAIAEVR